MTPEWLRFIADPGTDRLADLAPETWANIMPLAAQGGVLEALAVRLRASGALQTLPADVRARFEGIERQAAMSALTAQRTFVQVARALTSVGVPIVPRKGIVLAHTLYAEARMRPMTDVDLWVRDLHVPEALAALADAGLVVKPAEVRLAPYPRAWDGEIKLRRKDGPKTVAELHQGPFRGEWLHRAARVDRAGVWERLQPDELLGHQVRVLAAEDHALEVALHATINGQLSVAPLKQLLDLVLMARAGLAVEVLAARAAAWRVTRAVYLAFSLAEQCFEDPAVGRIARHVRLAEPRSGRLAAPGMPTANGIIAGRRLSQTRLARYVYFLRLADGHKGAARLLVRGAWPERSWLEAHYGSVGLGVRMRHLRSLVERRHRPPRP